MNEEAPKLRCIEAIGPWPFITRRHYEKMDHSRTVWHSRHHRKSLLLQASGEAEGLVTTLSACLWTPRQLNWWIGTVFAVGSLLFALASVLSLAPALARAWSLDSTAINAIFFAGSIPFTIAAYLQLYQAANAGEFTRDDTQSSRRPVLFGWRPHDIGWLSSALQFVGTILFNINTLDAMIPSLDGLQQDLEIWAPDFVGSILFLTSGYLAFSETCHAHWAWKPSSVSWWVVFTNLLGCVGFMISALFAIVLPGATNTVAVTLCIAFTLLGALCFLVGSLLMLPEAISPGEP
jgi:hypothetical protein